MISLKKQLFIAALVIAISAPVKAMDGEQDTAHMLNWKTAAVGGAALFVGAGFCVYKWLSKVRTADVKEDAVKASFYEQNLLTDDAQSHSIDSATVNVQEQVAPVAVDALIQALKNRPAGQKGRRKPTHRLPVINDALSDNVDQAASQVTLVEDAQKSEHAELGKKPAGGLGHGVQLSDLRKTQLKKTVDRTLVQPKPLPMAPEQQEEPAEQVLEQFAHELLLFEKAHTTNQKIEIAATIDSYVKSPSADTKALLVEYARIYCQKSKSQALAQAMQPLFAAKDAESRKAAAVKIKTETLRLLYH